MKKAFFLSAVMALFALTANAQTKKDGTPDMRYSANKQAYGTTYSAPAYSAPSQPSSGGSRPVYDGNTHTESHGGTYYGGQNSSHKGGTYVNPSTGNTYGVHKKE